MPYREARAPLAPTPPHTPQEVGLELEDSAAFEFLGRLPDRDITARGQRMADSALAAFVFAQRPGVAEPPLAVQASEIAATRWAHESCLRPAEVQYNVHRPYSLLPDRVVSLLPPVLLHSVGLDRVSFPAVELCALALPSDPRHRASCWDLARSHVTHHTPRAFGPSCRWEGARKRQQAPTFTLWGITLGITSDLLCLAGRDPLDEPPVYLHNAALRAAYQLHLLGPLSRSGKRRSRL